MSRARIAVLFYGALAAAAFAWGWLRGDLVLWEDPALLEATTPVRIAASLALGLALGGATVGLTRVVTPRFRWARELHGEFRALLGPLTDGEILTFALCSGISEELFFRGAMQPVLGLVPTAVVFGAIHIPPDRRLWAWSLWAGVMGLLFGGIVALTGQLLGAVVAHVLINYLNLRFIRDVVPPGTGAPPATAPPPTR
jgi:membrane protease YdiL (CAAX protease family)